MARQRLTFRECVKFGEFLANDGGDATWIVVLFAGPLFAIWYWIAGAPTREVDRWRRSL